MAFWPGDGDALDNGGTNHGTLAGGAGFAVGKVAQAFHLNGAGAQVALPKVPWWDFGTSSFSITAWFRANSTGNYANIIRYDSGFQGSGSWGLQCQPDGRISFGICLPSRTSYGTTTDNVCLDNSWHFISAVRDAAAGRIRVYIDGSLTGAEAWDGGIDVVGSADANLVIGAGAWGGEYFTGLIDEVAIFNRAISAEEIAIIYGAAGAGMLKSVRIVSQPQSQVGYWGKSVTLSVTATGGTPPYTYQWLKDGNPVSGATDAELVLSDLQDTDAGAYTVTVTDAANNSVTSQTPAMLTVNPAGVSIATCARLTIDGMVGQTYGIQVSTNLNAGSWTGAANVTLTQPIQNWYDSQSTAQQPKRFYRVVPGPISIP
ncbi:MAG: immunoglobulin domain-containing protein [Verrucomicrobia bacterium]|nr:immunoglobulin domain-containing protein [Verrucomicrobiota bacterium]